MKERKFIGNPDDPLCKASVQKPISKRVCKHNCKFYKNGKCARGYEF